jgi:nucleoid-associated protein YgaU
VYKTALKDFSTTSSFVREVLSDKGKPAKELKGATLSDAETAIAEINLMLANKLTLVEANAYRNMLTGLADTVASAAGEGLFGLGEKISKKELKALEKIKKALKPLPAAKAPAKPAAPAKPVAKPAAKPAMERVAKPAAKPVAKPAARPAARPAKKPLTRMSPSPQATMFMAEHTVVSGETLSHISLKYYNSATKPKYMVIYEANKDVIGDNPNLIIPGMVLKIPKL